MKEEKQERTSQVRERALACLGWCRTTASTAAGRLLSWLADPRFRRGVGYGIAGLLVLATLSKSLVKINESEVGVTLNQLTGNMSVEERPGFMVVLPWVTRTYLLDRRVQSLEMKESGGTAFGAGDAILVKTADGSSVSVDITVSYRVITSMADTVVRGAGPDRSAFDIWIRSAIRSTIANEFGTLNTEQVYDATARNEAANEAVRTVNATLEPHGLRVVSVVASDFRFYKEYEEIIKQKKLADQEVEEYQAQGRLAEAEHEREVAAAKAQAARRIIEAKGEAERNRATADGYGAKIRVEAESALLKADRDAEGLLATGLAEAEAQRQSARALAGAGGVNLVALEYAKKLGEIKFTGVPVMEEGRRGQIRVQSDTAAAATARGSR